MKISLSQAYLATLAYGDIFNFPLTLAEIKRWFLFYRPPARLPAGREVLTAGNYHFLSGRGAIVAIRKRREKEILGKMKLARRLAGLLKLIPTLKLVGITGGLAMGNAEAGDDIDFFLVAAKGTLWTSRLLATSIMEATGQRRRPGTREVRNTICLNMFMVEDHLSLPRTDRDLFSAHEVLQLKVLWERDGTYQKFLRANSWVKTFLPNAWRENFQGFRKSGDKSKLLLFFRFFEPIAKFIQLRYMQRHRTTEIVTDTVIRFHPKDARPRVKEALGRRLARFNLPLDKIFYNR